jgi:hypothetical protein
MEYRNERLIVVVKSCRRFESRRIACCSTWAGELCRRRVPLWFVVGGASSYDIVDEIISVPGRDDYKSNSTKLRDALTFLMEHDPFERIFVCDDDTFVHPDRFVAFKSAAEFVGLHNPPAIPWVHGGAGWFMSRRACELFVAGISRRCSWDDRLASEILATHGITLDNHPELFAQWDERVAPENQLITCHNVKPDEMRVLYDRNVSPVHDALS